MRSISVLIFSVTIHSMAVAQSNTSTLPYQQIPDYPASYTATTAIARMVDGLGFRYYWATEGLRAEDLAFKPSEEARSSEETIDHILGLSEVIINSVTNTPNIRGAENKPVLSFEEKRAKTLDNLKRASEILMNSSAEDLSNFNLVFQREDSSTEYPFWNQINGPISDAIWHVGQVVLLRRSSGNPFDSKVSVLQGKRRE